MNFSFLFVSLLAILGQLSDCITTQIALSMGGREANPLMVEITAHTWLHYCVKLGLPVLYIVICKKKLSSGKMGTYLLLMIAIVGFAAAIWNMNVIRHLL